MSSSVFSSDSWIEVYFELEKNPFLYLEDQGDFLCMEALCIKLLVSNQNCRLEGDQDVVGWSAAHHLLA